MLVEVALQVEVRERLRLRDGQQLTERRIRLDVVLVLQALLLDVRRDRLRDVGAGHLAALRLAEEAAEVITQLRGDLEDAEASRLRRAVLIELRRRAALALAGILDLTSHTLLELLQLGVQRGDRLTETIQAADHATDLIADRLDRLLNSRRALNRRHRRNDRRNDNRRRDNRLSLRRLLGDNLLLNSRRRDDNRRYRRRDRRRLNGILLGNTLRGNLSNRGGGVHCTSSGGRIHLYFTHYYFFLDYLRSNFYCAIHYFS